MKVPDENAPDENPSSPVGVYCEFHRFQGLTLKEYNRQVQESGRDWRCPVCGERAIWDKARYLASVRDELIA
jgi:hypothetical protein